MSDKTEVLTLRSDRGSRQWVEFLAKRLELSRSSVLERILTDYLERIQCCDRGPYTCDHVWCDICGKWAKDTGGTDPDTGEAYFNCAHYQGFSRWDDDIPEGQLRQNNYVDPFQVKTFRQFVSGSR